VKEKRAVAILVISAHLPVVGLYISLELSAPMQSVLQPPAASTFPLESRTAEANARATLGSPVKTQLPVLGL
jgi:hypothetical protein